MATLNAISLQVRNIAGHDFCKMEQYGEIHDWCSEFSYHFREGKSYALIGECGDGGWLLSTILTGRNKQNQGEILLNGNEISQKELQSISCYVGEGILNKKIGIFKNPIRKQISTGLKYSKQEGYTENDIAKLFGLREDRLSYDVEELSWARWRASIAVGFAFNKKVFCFPWCNTWMINELILNGGIHRCIDILTKNGAIVVIPTGNKESAEFLVDEVINLAKSLPSERAKEVVNEYKRKLSK